MNANGRIASLISSGTEMLFLLGLGDRVVGVSHECDFPPEVARLPRLTRSLVDALASSQAIDCQVRQLSSAQQALYELDVEQLAALAPELIITQAQCDVCAIRYDDVAAAVAEVPALQGAKLLALSPHSLADVLADIAAIGRAAGAESAAQRAIAALESRVSAVRNRTVAMSDAERPRVACLEWIEPPMLAANWMPELIAWAGGDPGSAAPGQHSSYADWRAIARFDPEVIVIMPCGFDLPRAIAEAQVLPRLDSWSGLAAVRRGQVFAADGNAFFNRSGPRLVDSLEILAHLFHPRLAPPPALPTKAWQRLTTRDGRLIPEEA